MAEIPHGWDDTTDDNIALGLRKLLDKHNPDFIEWWCVMEDDSIVAPHRTDKHPSKIDPNRIVIVWTDEVPTMLTLMPDPGPMLTDEDED